MDKYSGMKKADVCVKEAKTVQQEVKNDSHVRKKKRYGVFLRATIATCLIVAFFVCKEFARGEAKEYYDDVVAIISQDIFSEK